MISVARPLCAAVALCALCLSRRAAAQPSAASDCYVPNKSNGRIVTPAEELPAAAFQDSASRWTLEVDSSASPARNYTVYTGPNRYDDFVQSDFRLEYNFYCQEGELRPVFLQTSRDENGGKDHESNDAFISMNGRDFVKIFTRFENACNEWVYSAELELNFLPEQFLEEDDFEPATLECVSGVNTVAIVGRSQGYRIDYIVVGEPGVPAQDLGSRLSASDSESCPGAATATNTAAPASTLPPEDTDAPLVSAAPENVTSEQDNPRPSASMAPKSESPLPVDSDAPTDTTIVSPTVTPSSPNDPACFPGSASVLLMDGARARMDQLRLGDFVEVGDGKFEPIFFFSHFDPKPRTSFVSITTTHNDTLLLSSGHLVPLYPPTNSLVPARSLTMKAALLTASMTPVGVRSIVSASELGLFHPHTQSGRIVVDGVLTSCYTSVLPVMVADILLWPQKMWFNVFSCTLPGYGMIAETNSWGRHFLALLHRKAFFALVVSGRTALPGKYL